MLYIPEYMLYVLYLIFILFISFCGRVECHRPDARGAGGEQMAREIEHDNIPKVFKILNIYIVIYSIYFNLA